MQRPGAVRPEPRHQAWKPFVSAAAWTGHWRGSLPGEPCNYRLTIVTNALPNPAEMVERISERCETRVTELLIGTAIREISIPCRTWLLLPPTTPYGQRPDNIESMESASAVDPGRGRRPRSADPARLTSEPVLLGPDPPCDEDSKMTRPLAPVAFHRPAAIQRGGALERPASSR